MDGPEDVVAELVRTLGRCTPSDILALAVSSLCSGWLAYDRLLRATELPQPLSPLKHHVLPQDTRPTTLASSATTGTSSAGDLDASGRGTTGEHQEERRGSFDSPTEHSPQTLLLSELCYRERVPGMPQNPPPFRSVLEKLWRYVACQVDLHHRRLYRENCPKRIILVRHGESEANTDDTLYARVPDNAISLTPRGHEQAKAVGQALKEIIGKESVLFYVSPFTRTRQTYSDIVQAFEPAQVRMREDPRIREQEWGNLQPVEEKSGLQQKRALVGSFFFRFPSGESGADVFDRVSNFLESLFREFENGRAQNVVIIAHGLSIRLFLMRYFRLSVLEFESLANLHNCETVIMNKCSPDYKFYLERPLRVRTGAES